MRIKSYNPKRVTSGLEGTTSFGVDSENFGMMLEKLHEYGDPIGSIVREVTSNAVDAVDEARMIRDLDIESLMDNGIFEEVYKKVLKDGGDESEATGVWIDTLVDLKEHFEDWEPQNVLVSTETFKPSPFDPEDTHFVVEDKGIGLSPIRVEMIFSKYLSSTKRKTAGQIGAFGLGAKSPLGYGDSFTVKTVFLGVEYVYLVVKGAASPVIDLVSETEVDKPNGTRVEVLIKKGDLVKFENAAKRQLSYFHGVDVQNLGVQGGDIYVGKNFMFRENPPDHQVHLVLGRAYYPISLQTLGIHGYSYLDTRWNVPIGLYFDVDEVSKDEEEGKVTIVWNRESVQYNDSTIKTIKEKLYAAREEIQDLFNESQTPVSDFRGYWMALNTTENKVLVQASSGLIEIPRAELMIEEEEKEAKYPKYKSLPKLPKNPFMYWDVVRILDSSGNGLRKPSKYTMTVENLMLKGRGTVEYARGSSSSSVKNRYIAECLSDHSGDIYFLRRTEMGDDNYFGIKEVSKVYFDCPYPDEDELRLIQDFLYEVDDYVREHSIDYATIEPSEEFLEMLKEEKREKRERKKERIARGTHEIPIKRFCGSETGWKMQNMTISEAAEGTSLTIYGFQADREKLESMARLLSEIPWIRRVYGKETPSVSEYVQGVGFRRVVPDTFRVLSISMQNEEYFKENPQSFHIDTFMSDPHRIFSRYITALMVRDNLRHPVDKLIHPAIQEAAPRLWTAAKHIQTYLAKNLTVVRRPTLSYQTATGVKAEFEEGAVLYFRQEHARRTKYNARLKKTGSKLPKLPSVYDESILPSFKLVQDFHKNFPLLFSISPEANVDDIRDYLTTKSTANAELLERKKKAFK